MTKVAGFAELHRSPSGVLGIDTIIGGGFFKGGIYIIQGMPGTGKTILGNQICFNHVAAGGVALYTTLLVENHDRMLGHIAKLAFVDPSLVARGLNYVSGYAALDGGGLPALANLVRREAQQRRASFLVLDGLIQAGERAGSITAFKEFIRELHTMAGVLDCTVLLLTSARDHQVGAENTMVDGMLLLENRAYGWGSERELTISKFRGSDHLQGRHAYAIDDTGIVVYPRLEALFARPTELGDIDVPSLPSGVAGLDPLMGGGVAAGSSTLVGGPTGSGKTLMGLHFLSGSTPREPGLHLGFYETQPRLLRKAQACVPAFARAVAAGDVALHWQPPTERLLDRLGHDLLAAVRQRGVKRLVVDGLNAFQRVAEQRERGQTFFTALTNELRAMGVTTLFTVELPGLITPIATAPLDEVSQIADNVVLLNYADDRGALQRSLTVIKVRDSAIGPGSRRLDITDAGLVVRTDVPTTVGP